MRLKPEPMRRLLRLFIWLIPIATIGLGALGLFNSHRGLPLNSLAGVRELPLAFGQMAREYLDPAYARRLGAGDNGGATTNPRLLALRAAIGCDQPGGGAMDSPIMKSAFRWRDKTGVINYADEAPANVSAQHHTLRDGETDFAIRVSVEDAVLPTRLERQLQAGARRTYEHWRQWLGDDAVVRSNINLRFVGDAERFAAIYGKADGEEWTTTGFYRIRSNEALILFTPDFQDTALATAFHEMSHLITAWQLGPTPPWLNEGIAEHFESLPPEWSGTGTPVNLQHLARLRREGPLPLEALTKLSRRDWATADPERRYASAWALVAYLLNSERGQNTLQQVLRTANSQRCSTPADLQVTLDEHYPGGLEALESSLHLWLEETYSSLALRRP